MDYDECGALRPQIILSTCFQHFSSSELKREFLAQEMMPLRAAGGTTLLERLDSTIAVETILALLPLLWTAELLVPVLTTHAWYCQQRSSHRTKQPIFCFFSKKLQCAEYFGLIINIF